MRPVSQALRQRLQKILSWEYARMRKRIKGGESKEAAVKDCGGTEKPEILKSIDAEIKIIGGRK